MKLAAFLEPPRIVYGIADDGEIHAGRCTDVSDDHGAVIEGDPDVELNAPFLTPAGVQAGGSFAHGDRASGGVAGVFTDTRAADVAPNGHDGVAHELVECAAVLKDAIDHLCEVFVELGDERMRVQTRCGAGEIAQVGKENGNFACHSAEGLEVSGGLIEQFRYNILANVTLEGTAHLLG